MKSKTSPGRIAATLSRASARTRASSVATMRGVKALIASLRWRLCSGGSIRMIDGALSSGLIWPARRSGISKSCVPWAEEKRRGRREISSTSACRVAHQKRPGRVPVQRVLGAQPAEGGVRIGEVEVDLVGGESGGHAVLHGRAASLAQILQMSTKQDR